MKKVIAIMGILLLVAFLAAPVLANRGGWGGWSRVGGYCGQSGWYSSLPEKQSNELVKLEERFYNDTAELRHELWSKSEELSNLLNTPDPDLVKVKTLQKEINDLRAKLDRVRIDYELQARKVAPDTGYGRAYSRGYGRNMGGQRGMFGRSGHHW